MKNLAKTQKNWWCPRCLAWFSYDEACGCGKALESSRLRRTKDRGLHVVPVAVENPGGKT